MIFTFIVRHLHFLAKIPLAAHFFNAALLTWTALFHRERLRAMERLEQNISNLPNVNLCLHRFGGTGFVHTGHEFAHLHGNGLLDIELSRDLAAQFVREKRALPHHVLGPSRWVSLWLNSLSDIPNALDILQLACENKKAGQLAGLVETA